MRIRPLHLALPLALVLTGSALAQAPVVVAPGAAGAGAPGVVSRQSNAVGEENAATYSPTGQPADTISNDSAAAGNANQPERVAPQGGGGGK